MNPIKKWIPGWCKKKEMKYYYMEQGKQGLRMEHWS
jgi:hypothetical protein